MRIIRNLHDLGKAELFFHGSVVSIGKYDGVHLGHQRLLQILLAKGEELELPTVVIIFEPQPEEYFQPSASPPRIMCFSEKINALRAFGIDVVVVLKFDSFLANISAENFIEKILIRMLQVKYVNMGADFTFGYGAKGDSSLLKKFGNQSGFQVEVVPYFFVDNTKVSATYIRSILHKGDLSTAKKFLGRPYRVTGRVVHGIKRGRELGFPTANVATCRRVLPVAGVYVVLVTGLSDGDYYGIANIGFRPTFGGTHQTLEIYLFDFNRDIYGSRVTVEFLIRIRDEKKFTDFTLLCQQVEQDKLDARRFLADFKKREIYEAIHS